jgi:hypothetical protein
VNGNPSTGVRGSIPPAPAIEQPQREIVNVIAQAGLTPQPGDLTQLWQALQKQRGSRYGTDTSNTPNLIVVTFDNPSVAAYEEGLSVLVKIANTNSGPSTINVNALGAKSIKRPDGDDVSAGDLPGDGIALLAYDGTDFQLITSVASATVLAETNFEHYGVDTGTANALVVTSPQPALTALSAGLVIHVDVANSNTAQATINVGGLGAKAIKRGNGGNLQTADLVGGTIAELVYDGTQFQLINPQQWGGTPTTPTLPDNWNDITGSLRPYFIAVNSATTTSPPGGPSVGDTYLIPAGATGSWAAHVNQIAQYTGATLGWVYRTFPQQSMVGVPQSDDFYKRTSAGTWRSIFADLSEHLSGTSTTLATNPAGVAAMITAAIDTYDSTHSVSAVLLEDAYFLGMM